MAKRKNRKSAFPWVEMKKRPDIIIDTSKPDLDNGRSKLSREGFYASTKWIKVRNAFRKANPLCIRCKAMGYTRPMEVVDHVLAADDYPEFIFDWGNLQSLCNPCHNHKTAIDSALRRGQKVRHLNQDLMDSYEENFEIE
jgi:5-methylcytosine-specific restriction endonuclease McrA